MFFLGTQTSSFMAVEVLRAPGLMDSGPLVMPPAPQLAGYFADFNAPQEYLQPQMPSLRPKEQRKRQGRRKGGAGGKRKRQAGGSGAGQHPNAPSLKALQQNNAKGARRHFSHSKPNTCRDSVVQRQQSWFGRRGVRPFTAAGKEEMPNAVTPRTVPHAPLNTTGFLMAQNGVPPLLATLSRAKAACAEAASVEATGSHTSNCLLYSFVAVILGSIFVKPRKQ